MRRGRMIGALLALVWTITGSASAATASPTAAGIAPSLTPKTSPSSDIVDRYDAAVDAFQTDQCDRATEMLEALTTAPDFGRLADKYQSMAFGALGFCAEQRHDWKAAYAAFVRASNYAEAVDIVFAARFETADALGHVDDAVAALEIAADKRPASLRALTPDRLSHFLHVLQKQGREALRTRSFAAIDRADYRPEEPFRTGSYIWIDYAAELADAGDQTAAARVLARVDYPDALAAAQTDRRLFAILDADPPRFDIRTMAERGLASDRQAMAAHPELLDGPVQVAIDLRALGRPEEALALLDAMLPRLKDPTTFQDFSEKVVWFWDERSRSLRDLGRVDDAIQALKTGSLAAGTGQADINLVLNLADLQVMAGQPQQAIETARSSEKLPASPYGHLFGDQSLACAYAQLGRKAELQATLAHLHAQEPDNWTAAVDAELCAGDLDAAAAAVIRALADVRWRREVLLELSHFEPPAHQTPIERQMDERRVAVAKRPDVQAAIAKVGRTMRFNIGRPEG